MGADIVLTVRSFSVIGLKEPNRSNKNPLALNQGGVTTLRPRRDAVAGVGRSDNGHRDSAC